MYRHQELAVQANQGRIRLFGMQTGDFDKASGVFPASAPLRAAAQVSACQPLGRSENPGRMLRASCAAYNKSTGCVSRFPDVSRQSGAFAGGLFQIRRWFGTGAACATLVSLPMARIPIPKAVRLWMFCPAPAPLSSRAQRIIIAGDSQ